MHEVIKGMPEHQQKHRVSHHEQSSGITFRASSETLTLRGCTCLEFCKDFYPCLDDALKVFL